MSDDHKRGSKKGLFCGVPGTPRCACGNDYIEICKPKSWADEKFARLVKAKAGHFSFQKKYEAHHLVCVAPVSSELIAKPSIEGVIKETAWCINNKDNMLAMPLWGHTVKWYCAITAAGGDIDDSALAPPFANIPQHDWDHNCRDGYTWEVEQAAKRLASEAEKKGHDLKPEDLKSDLEQMSENFSDELKARGKRQGGTHDCWKDGGSKDGWCQPFSMASTPKVSSKGYPVKKFDEAVAKWIKRISTAISGA